jgi:hypothetical protein
MTIPGSIFSGDLVRALVHVGDSSGENWPAIAAMLGFRLNAGTCEHRETGGQSYEAPVLPSISEEKVLRKAQDSPVLPGLDMGAMLEFEIERSMAPPENIPSEVPGVDEPKFSRPLALSPLFHGLWERGVLLALAGTPRPEGQLAIVEAVQLIARCEVWRDLPLEKIQSASKGCQVLVDTGIGMRPFVADTRQLVQSLRMVVGAEHVRVLTYVDCPSRGVLTQAYQDETYRAPDNGATVVAVSDLCGGGPRAAIREAEPGEWLAVAKLVRDAGSPFVVLNPYPPDRWPERLAESIPVVHWHVTTRAADVRRTRRQSRS